ncbi:endolytic transglycosylase MltG [Streptomyces sp. YU58]|uniref:endolytic transglycosylase MltG n=1 Tax=Streptomyces sp. SX92 TaxID=3158972 RepID=UPI0027B8F358|nr:endolytic transglycosylase MltG [Streptomyces coralus]WLW56474.1 endolytic transglycosylase MltG [Streptomyces coralus]
MTEYGRGQDSEPWHPEDPLYGDGGWGGQQAQEGRQSPYGGQPQHYPEQPQQPQYDNGGWGDGQQAAYGQAQQHDPHQQYQQQYGEQQYDQQYNGQQYNGPQHHGQQYDGSQHNGQQYEQQQYAAQTQQQYDNGSWGTGTHTHVQYTDPSDPYGRQNASYGGDQPDYYGTPDAYPPPEPPSRRQAEPEPPRTDWDPGPDQGEHAFFSGADDDDDSDDPRDDRDERRSRGGKKPKKRRSGCACLVLTLIFVGGVGGVGYFGYQFYQDRFGSAPDFAGDGTGETVPVSVPTGAGGAEIGRLLKAAGVVKSVDAFVSAFAQNKDSAKIQAGSYLLNKEMSAESAVALMLDPKSQNNLLIPEGTRNAKVYELIDARLGVSKGTTAKVAKEDYKKLGLPDWALDQPNLKDPLEGFLYPSAYAASKGEKPESVLKDMVARATEKYEELGLEKKAESLGLDGPWQLLTVASLVQAEGTSHDDFRKMAEVVYNRLKPGNPQTNGMLEFDSTYNYVKNQSKIDLTIAELRQYDNRYNTYFYKGLPPGPIDNPGEDALKGALTPTSDGWYYFISLDGKTSKFTKTLAEHDRLVQEFNASRNNG